MSTTSTNLIEGLAFVTDQWAKWIKKEERGISAALGRGDLWDDCPGAWSKKDAAYFVMKEAYDKASSNGQYPAMARQIYYAARGRILNLTEKETLESNYFTQTLLPSYMEDHPEETASWNVAYDARGRLTEPHTNKIVPLGTVEVGEYLRDIRGHCVSDVEADRQIADYPTCGPEHRYSAILFIEKEGFYPLFEQVKLAERYDLALMSTKGMSVTACRELVDDICGGQDIPLLVLHDFDKAGFSIVQSLQKSNRRYTFEHDINVIDLGLRLEDVRACELESETVGYSSDPRSNLRDNGATKKEVEFLCGDERHGRRVEINAFTSEQLIRWLEAKLQQHEIHKVVPTGETLDNAYRRAIKTAIINEQIAEIHEAASKEARQATIPASLESEVQSRLDRNPEVPWDDVLVEIVAEDLKERSLGAPASGKRGVKKKRTSRRK